jgi:hypothetical protein
MLRRLAKVGLLAVVLTAAMTAGAATATAATKPADVACNQYSPLASPCIGMDKNAEAGAAVCRSTGVPDGACVMPVGHDNLASERAAYQQSWLHQAAQFQYRLGTTVPLRDAQWLGTHNSFNTDSNSVTLSHTDSNQQLTLSQQLDSDVRALELDVHWVPSLDAGGSNAVVVCHGRGPDQYNAGCTNEPLFTNVLPEIAGWLNAHPDQVILLYIEDELYNATGYAQTISALEQRLRRPDGSSMIYHPDPAKFTSGHCADMPLGVSRHDIRAAGANVMVVGNCRSGWSSDVFSWDSNHVESGNTAAYRPFPACDASYPRSVYASQLVRYFEDSTWVAAAVSPTESPSDAAAAALSPARVSAMVGCGVNLFGFDQLTPTDGRIEASIWSWAPGQPKVAGGGCGAQGTDSRWITRPCASRRPAACQDAAGNWSVTTAPVVFTSARAACAAQGAQFAVPRTGLDNSLLYQASGGEVWIKQRA